MTTRTIPHHPPPAVFGWICRLLLAVLTALPVPYALADDVVVIANRDNPNSIDRAYVAKIYTGALKGWPDGTSVIPFDQEPESEVRQNFYGTIVGKSPANMRAIWSQNIFTGKGLPPKIAVPDAEMKRLVAANRNAIGYIRASQLDGSVKVIER
jgi:ABC-type phosphate transport system substrate-binding protein